MNIKAVFKKLFFLLILFSFICPCFIFAADQNQGKSLEINYPKSPFSGLEITGIKTPLPVFIKYVFEFSVFFVISISILLLVFAGFKYITSMGNPAATKDAKERIGSAILGIAIVLFAFLILNTIDPNLLKGGFKIPEINLSITAPTKIEEIKNINNFQQIPISYLILNRFLGRENYIASYFAEKEKTGAVENLEKFEIRVRKLANDGFEQNRLDNIYNENAWDITGKKKLYVVDSSPKQEYQGVAVYTKIIIEKIGEKTNELAAALMQCQCDKGNSKQDCASEHNPWRFRASPVNSSAGWWLDSGACENFPCGTQPCSVGTGKNCQGLSYPCKSHCQCYGEPCPNRKELRQLQTDLELLANALEVYIDGNQWVSEWIKSNSECFEKGVCKKFKEIKDCHNEDKKQCYTWLKEEYDITEKTKKFIYQIAKNEQVYGGLGEVINDLEKQRDQILKARGDIYYGSKYYLEQTSFGLFWTEPYYKFTKASLDEFEKLFQMEHADWKESKNNLMEIDTDGKNKKFCEEELKGSWKVIAEGIKPEELSLRAVCSFSQEFKSPEYGKDPVNNWDIFYKNISPQSKLEKKEGFLSDLIPVAMAFDQNAELFDLGCIAEQSIKIPIGEAIKNSLEMIEKILDNLDDKKTSNVNRKEVIKYIMAEKKLPGIQSQIKGLTELINRWKQQASKMKDPQGLYAEINNSQEKKDLDRLKGEESSLQILIKNFKENVKTYNFKDLDLKEIATYVVNDTREIVDTVDGIKGSVCQTEMIQDSVRNCCQRPCPACSECSKSKNIWDKFFSFLKIKSVSAYGCNCPPPPCPPCECGCYYERTEERNCDYCSSCEKGHCESCKGDPLPQNLRQAIELISLYNNPSYSGIELNPEFPKLTVDYYIGELKNIITQPQQWESGPATYVEKINTDLRTSAESFSSPKYCNSFPTIGSKDYDEWLNGIYFVPLLIDKNMAATTYGINAADWKKLVGYEYNFYCCLPYKVK
jgi:hypothetical protein